MAWVALYDKVEQSSLSTMATAPYLNLEGFGGRVAMSHSGEHPAPDVRDTFLESTAIPATALVDHTALGVISPGVRYNSEDGQTQEIWWSIGTTGVILRFKPWSSDGVHEIATAEPGPVETRYFFPISRFEPTVFVVRMGPNFGWMQVYANGRQHSARPGTVPRPKRTMHAADVAVGWELEAGPGVLGRVRLLLDGDLRRLHSAAQQECLRALWDLLRREWIVSGTTAVDVVDLIVKELLVRGIADLPRRADLTKIRDEVSDLRREMLEWQVAVGERLTSLEASISGSGEIPAPPQAEAEEAEEKPEESWRVVLAKKPAVVFLGLVALGLLAVVLQVFGFDWAVFK